MFLFHGTMTTYGNRNILKFGSPKVGLVIPRTESGSPSLHAEPGFYYTIHQKHNKKYFSTKPPTHAHCSHRGIQYSSDRTPPVA